MSIAICMLTAISAHVPVGIEDGTAWRLASDGLIHDWWKIFPLLERIVQSRDGDYGAGSLRSCRRPDVPRETDSIAILDVVDVCVNAGVGGVGGCRGESASPNSSLLALRGCSWYSLMMPGCGDGGDVGYDERREKMSPLDSAPSYVAGVAPSTAASLAQSPCSGWHSTETATRRQ